MRHGNLAAASAGRGLIGPSVDELESNLTGHVPRGDALRKALAADLVTHARPCSSAKRVAALREATSSLR